MSYCRWSDDDFRCDFYAYGDRDGYRLHLAGVRTVWDPPPSPYDLKVIRTEPGEFRQVYRQYHQALERAERIPIKHPLAGQMLQFNTLEEMRAKMAELLAEGFRAPDWVLERIDDEIGETAP